MTEKNGQLDHDGIWWFAFAAITLPVLLGLVTAACVGQPMALVMFLAFLL